MTTVEKTSTRRWLAAWLVLSIILVLAGLWRMRGSSGEDVAASSQDGYAPPRLVLTGEVARSVPAARADGGTAARSYQEALRNRQLGRLEERWREEARREDWTRETASWIEAELKRMGIPGQPERPDCRQSLCRLRVVFDDPGDAGRIYAVQLNPRTNWYTDFRAEGGRMVVTAYLGAPGNNLRGIINDPFVR
jgi:hypothetical protein